LQQLAHCVSPRFSTAAASAARWGLLVFLLVSGLTRAASAQTGLGGATGTTALTASDLLIVVQSAPGAALPDFDLQRFFNVSNCQCQTPISLYFTFSQSGFQKKFSIGTGSIEFWVGLNCNNISVRNCQKLGDTVALTTFANQSGVVIQTDTQTLSQNFGQPATSTVTITDGGVLTGVDGGPSGAGACNTGIAFSQTIWALATLSDGVPNSVSATLLVNVDLAPPPAPMGVAVNPGNEALIAGWTGLDTSVNVDLLGYQLLCDRAGELQVFPTGAFSSGFTTCPGAPLPSGLNGNVYGLDPRFVCSPLLSTLTSSYRIKILENGITYGVAVVAVDTHYNASAPQVIYQAPTKTLSFYDVYRNGDSANMGPGDKPDPGRATGGYCAVGGSPRGAAGAVGLGAVVASVVLVAWRRRRRRQQ
jgi:hypothetical protein